MNLTLIGMPGSGKSTLGAGIARRLNWNFIDTDELIVQQRNALQTILDEKGAEAFRKIEEEAILSLKGLDSTIISPGGSVVYSDRSMQHLKNFSQIVFLNVPLEIVRTRVDEGRRGIIGLREKGWDALFAERLVLYKKYADMEIGLSEDFPEANEFRILAALRSVL